MFDDHPAIENNPFIKISSLTIKDIARSLQGYSRSRPVTSLTFALNYRLAGMNVGAYHVTNIIIHILTAYFLFLLVGGTLNIERPDIKASTRLIAFFSALLWMVNPVQTQSVTYIVQRMNSLSAMFFILACYSYLRFKISKGKQSTAWFFLCLIFSLLSIGSKENALILPFVIFIYDRLFLGDPAQPNRFKPVLLFGIACSILLLIAAIFMHDNIFNVISSTYKDKNFTIIERIMTEWRVVIYYISLIFFPDPSRLSLEHDYPVSHAILSPPTTIICLAALACLLLFSFIAIKKHRFHAFAVLWFLLTLSIESSFIGLALIYEHRLYLPSAMLAASIVLTLFTAVRNKKTSTVILLLICIVFSYWTIKRNEVWHDRTKFWTDCVNKAPKLARPAYNLAQIYNHEGKIDKAEKLYQRALKNSKNRIEFAWAYIGLGDLALKKGDLISAAKYLARSIDMEPNNPEAHMLMGKVMLKQGKPGIAEKYFRAAMSFNPNIKEIYNNLGKALSAQGKQTDAIAVLKTGIRLFPDYAEALSNLGNLLAETGKTREAEVCFRKAAALAPDNSEIRINISLLLAREGRFSEASQELKKVLQIDPENKKAQAMLRKINSLMHEYDKEIRNIMSQISQKGKSADLLTKSGIIHYKYKNKKEAERSFREALVLDPYYGQALFFLGVICTEEKRYNEAISYFQKSTADPDIRARAYYNIACIYSKKGETEKSLNQLKEAVAAGYKNKTSIKNDPDLENLRKSRSFDEWFSHAFPETSD